MPEDLLTGIDDAFARKGALRVKRLAREARALVRDADSVTVHVEVAEDDTPARTFFSDDHVLYAFFAIQFLWGAILFVPGSQALRGYVRALPYLASLALFVRFFLRHPRVQHPAGIAWVVAVLFLLLLNLLHPSSQLTAGIAQCVFQFSIMAPMFWAYKAIRTPAQFERLLVLIFLMNFASAALGVLQVYYPDQFMPSQFNSLGVALKADYVESLTYLGSDGRMIVRPPGLTDQPGGAALAGGLTALLGLALSIRLKSPVLRVLTLGAVAVGMAAIYLTQVRSVLLMVIGCVGVLVVIALKQGRHASAGWLVAGGGTVVVAAFLWAATLGGASVSDRFLSIGDEGALQTYQENRGNFLSFTVGELLDKYPLGAGVGRWGMMNTYFGDPYAFESEPIHSEIQLTGWLLDGGWPMWILCIGAICASVFAGFALSNSRHPATADVVLQALTLQVFITGLAMAGPIFNTQMGLFFWTLGSALHGAVHSYQPDDEEQPA